MITNQQSWNYLVFWWNIVGDNKIFKQMIANIGVGIDSINLQLCAVSGIQVRKNFFDDNFTVPASS
jgi:lactate dehydrogenase-like 2-hydroxyacid dehydrogenase